MSQSHALLHMSLCPNCVLQVENSYSSLSDLALEHWHSEHFPPLLYSIMNLYISK